MRIRTAILAAALAATGLSLAGCRNHPGRYGDHDYHHHHDGDHDHDGDHGGYGH
jgi:hypothetical protein